MQITYTVGKHSHPRRRKGPKMPDAKSCCFNKRERGEQQHSHRKEPPLRVPLQSLRWGGNLLAKSGTKPLYGRNLVEIMLVYFAVNAIQ